MFSPNHPTPKTLGRQKPIGDLPMDCITYAFGYLPTNELFRLLRVSHEFHIRSRSALAQVRTHESWCNDIWNTKPAVESVQKYLRGLRNLFLYRRVYPGYLPRALRTCVQTQLHFLSNCEFEKFFMSFAHLKTLKICVGNRDLKFVDHLFSQISSKLSIQRLEIYPRERCNLAFCSNLTSLKVYGWHLGHTIRGLSECFGNSPALEYLKFFFCNLDDTATKDLDSVTTRINMKEFDFEGTYFKDDVMTSLAKIVPNLTRLTFNRCKVSSPVGFESFLRLQKLVDVRVWFCSLRGVSWEFVLPCLEKFEAFSCELDDESLGEIAYAMPNLVELAFLDNSAVSMNGLKRLVVMKRLEYLWCDKRFKSDELVSAFHDLVWRFGNW